MCKSSLRTLDYKPSSRPIFTQLPERELVSIFMYVVKYRILTHLPNYTFNREKSVFCSLFSNWMCDIDQRFFFKLLQISSVCVYIRAPCLCCLLWCWCLWIWVWVSAPCLMETWDCQGPPNTKTSCKLQ